MLEITSRTQSVDDDFHDGTAGVDALGNVRAVASNVVPQIGGSVGRRIDAATTNVGTVTTNTTGNQLRKALEGRVAGAAFNHGVKRQQADEGTAVLKLDLEDVAHLLGDCSC